MINLEIKDLQAVATGNKSLANEERNTLIQEMARFGQFHTYFEHELEELTDQELACALLITYKHFDRIMSRQRATMPYCC